MRKWLGNSIFLSTNANIHGTNRQKKADVYCKTNTVRSIRQRWTPATTCFPISLIKKKRQSQLYASAVEVRKTLKKFPCKPMRKWRKEKASFLQKYPLKCLSDYSMPLLKLHGTPLHLITTAQNYHFFSKQDVTKKKNVCQDVQICIKTIYPAFIFAIFSVISNDLRRLNVIVRAK